jgi:hypothetical protein
MNTKFERERYCVEQLARHLGLPDDLECQDPLVEGHETGADVVILPGDRRVGIQVTEYDGAEAVPGLKPGQMRAAEKLLIRDAGSGGGVYVGWGSPHFGTAFPARIAVKVEKCKLYNFLEYDEIWLLISANVPGVGSSTYVPHRHISPGDLNYDTNDILTNSRYTKAFLHVIMGDALFGWGRPNGWQSIPRSTLER